MGELRKTTLLLFFYCLFPHVLLAQWLPSSASTGLVNCLSANGSVLYSGWGSIYPLSTGGILVSRDNGITWNDLDSGQIGSSVYTIAAQGSLMYAGAGYVFYDIGDTNSVSLWRSTDSGQSWEQIHMKKGYEGFGSLAVRGSHLFAVESYNLNYSILRSDDSGKSWKVLSDSFYSSLAFEGAKIYAASGLGLLVSTDVGETWKMVGLRFGTSVGEILIRDSLIVASIFAPNLGDPQLDTGEFIAFSSDSGGSWKESFIGPPVNDLLVNIAFDGKTIFGTNGNSVGTSWCSRDMGKRWASLTNRPDGIGGPNLVSSLVISGDNLVAGTQEEGIWYYPLSSLSVSTPSDAVPSASIAPNPAMGIVTIRGAARAVVVTNVLGEQVAGNALREPGSGNITLDLSKLPAGTYFARIETGNGMVVRTIIKE